MDFKFFKPWVKQYLSDNFLNGIVDAAEEQFIILKRVDPVLLKNFVFQESSKAIDQLCLELDQLPLPSLFCTNDDKHRFKKKRKELKRLKKLLLTEEDFTQTRWSNEVFGEKNDSSESQNVLDSVSTVSKSKENKSPSKSIQNKEHGSGSPISDLRALHHVLSNASMTSSPFNNFAAFETKSTVPENATYTNSLASIEMSQKIKDHLKKRQSKAERSHFSESSPCNISGERNKSKSIDSNNPNLYTHINSKSNGFISNLLSHLESHDNEEIKSVHQVSSTSKLSENEGHCKPVIRKRFFSHFSNVLTLLSENSRQKLENELLKAVCTASKSSDSFKQELKNSDFYNIYKKSKRKKLQKQDSCDNIPANCDSLKSFESNKSYDVPSNNEYICLDTPNEFSESEVMSSERIKKKKKKSKNPDTHDEFLESEVILSERVKNKKSRNFSSSCSSLITSREKKNKACAEISNVGKYLEEEETEMMDDFSEDLVMVYEKKDETKKSVKSSKFIAVASNIEKENKTKLIVTDDESCSVLNPCDDERVCRKKDSKMMKHEKLGISNNDNKVNAFNDVEAIIPRAVVRKQAQKSNSHKIDDDIAKKFQDKEEICYKGVKKINNFHPVTLDGSCSAECSNTTLNLHRVELEQRQDEIACQVPDILSGDESSDESIEVLLHTITDIVNIKQEICSSNDEVEDTDPLENLSVGNSVKTSSNVEKNLQSICGETSVADYAGIFLEQREKKAETYCLLDSECETLRQDNSVNYETSTSDLKNKSSDRERKSSASKEQTQEIRKSKQLNLNVVDEKKKFRLLEKELLELELRLFAADKRHQGELSSVSKLDQPSILKESVGCVSTPSTSSTHTVLKEENQGEKDGTKSFNCHKCGQNLIDNQHLLLHLFEHVKQTLAKMHFSKWQSNESITSFIPGEKEINETQHRQANLNSHIIENDLLKYSYSVIGKTRRTNQPKSAQNSTLSEVFKCIICSSEFKRESSLKRHLKAHETISSKKFKCKLCGAVLRNKSQLKRHMRDHSTFKSFVCNECGTAYTRKENLIRHKKAKHGN